MTKPLPSESATITTTSYPSNQKSSSSFISQSQHPLTQPFSIHGGVLEMTGDGNLSYPCLILILSLLSYLYLISLSPSTADTHLRIYISTFIPTVTILITPFRCTLYIFTLPTYELSVVSTHLTESEYSYTYFIILLLILLYSIY